MKRTVAVLAVGVGMLLAPGGASASTPVTVHAIGCALSGGSTSVPAGSTISFAWGWSTADPGLDQDFLNALTLSASTNANGVIANTASYWGPITPFGGGPGRGGGDVTTWTYPTGVTLTSGTSITFSMDATISHLITDFPPTQYEPGDLFSDAGLPSPIVCTVTAT